MNLRIRLLVLVVISACAALPVFGQTCTLFPATINGPASICANGNAAVTVTAYPGPGQTYSWSVTGGSILGSSTSPTLFFRAFSGASVTINVTVTNTLGCSTGTKVIPINANPSVFITAPTTACANSGPYTATAPAGAASYDWTVTNGAIVSGQGTSSIQYTTGSTMPTVVRVTATNASGCSRSTQVYTNVADDYYSGTPAAAGVAPSATDFQTPGGTGTVTVTTSCPWTATSSAPWLAITSGASGTGNGTVAFSVAPNPLSSSRSAMLTVAGVPLSIEQHGTGIADGQSPSVSTLITAPYSGGFADGPGSAARFLLPTGTVSDAAGNIYVADSRNHVIRKVDPSGNVTTFAGSPNNPGYLDGTGTGARFLSPQYMTIDPSGNLYVTEGIGGLTAWETHTIRKVTPAGVVTTLAGRPGVGGYADGTGTGALFHAPQGIVYAPDGNLYVADAYNCVIRRVTMGGVVTTVAGVPWAWNSVDGPVSSARFQQPVDLAVDAAGDIYVLDHPGSPRIRKISGGSVTTIAGPTSPTVFSSTPVDGVGTAARFVFAWSMTLHAGDLYVDDSRWVRKVTLGGAVTTVVAAATTVYGIRTSPSGDMTIMLGNQAARLTTTGSITTVAGFAGSSSPIGSGPLAIDTSGNILMATGTRILQITPTGTVSTFAGVVGSTTSVDGPLTSATFASLTAITVSPSGAVYVVDKNTIRVISGGFVSTIAGSSGAAAVVDGTGSTAGFAAPAGLAVDAAGTIYVADYSAIRRVTSGGVVTTIAGHPSDFGFADGSGSAARFSFLSAMAMGPDGNLYVGDANYSTISGVNAIRRVTPAGAVTTLAGLPFILGSGDGTGQAVRFESITGLAFDPAGNLYITDGREGTLRMMTPGGVVTTPAGMPLHLGSVDGIGSGALFVNPQGIAADASGNIYISDLGTLRRASAVIASADLSLAVTVSRALATVGDLVTYTITITNNGPGPAASVVVSDPTPSGLTFVRNSGDCTSAFPCTLGTINAGETRTINAVFRASSAGPVTNAITLSSATGDPVAANNSATSSITINNPPNPCPTAAPIQISPAPGTTSAPLTGGVAWTGNGADSYQIYFGPAGSGCSGGSVMSSVPSISYSGLETGRTYESRIVAIKSGCSPVSSGCASWTTTCQLTTPALIGPLGGTISSPATFSWTAVPNAEKYVVVVSIDGGPEQDLGTTTATSLKATIDGGKVAWYVKAIARNCQSVGARSAVGSFDSCGTPEAPLAGVVGAPTSGNSYAVTWDAVPGANRYLIEEADNDAFVGAAGQETTARSVSFRHEAASGQAFFYRVRALSSCSSAAGPFSKVIRVVIVPAPTNQRYPSVNVPLGSTRPVDISVFVPGEASGPVNFTASLDKPWLLSVTPQSGTIPPEGTTLKVLIDPSALPNGTFTGNLTISISPAPAAKGLGASATTTKKSVPVTVNLVTPIVPVDLNLPTPDTMIIPAVGRLTGANSQWRSDVRIYNGSASPIRYQLDFIPSMATEAKRTTIDTDPGVTTALDDVIHNWYGFGEIGDSANGILAIRAVTPAGSPAGLVPVVSSRTYNYTAFGTLGQFIPGIPFRDFVGRSSEPSGTGSVLSLQQLAQNAKFRTNIGLIEALGTPASVLVTGLNGSGAKLFDLPVDLKGGEQKMLNGLLGANGVTSADVRLEVRVVGGNGKVSAYASVVDNANGDPMLIEPVIVGQTRARKYVLPGVVNTAAWRTDVRILNNGADQQPVDLVFYPQGGGAPHDASMTMHNGEMKALDDVVASLFAVHDAGGALHISTPADSSLVVTGRTYTETSNGTVGQFVPAATPEEGVEQGGRSLNILQLEESVRHRTNIGLAEMSGKAATVEVSVVLPDVKATPSIQLALAANEFRQMSLRDLGVADVYNARVLVKVIDGAGRVTAYGSVIDMQTNAPTYVPAQ